MILSRLFLAFAIAAAVPPALGAETASDSSTLGVRFSGLVIQEVLSAPPLPSLDADNKRHVSVQAIYGSGEVGRSVSGTQGGASQFTDYVGKPRAYAVGSGYTSRSRGLYSYFAFGVHTRATTDVAAEKESSFSQSITDSTASASALGLGMNYVLIGSIQSAWAVGVFGGAIASLTQTGATFGSPSGSTEPTRTFKVTSSTLTYGPMIGLQTKLRMGALSITPYGLYFADATDKCLNYEASGQKFDCVFSMDSSFAAAGLNVGLYKFRLVVYSKVWSNIEARDTKLSVYQIGYTFDF